MTRPRNHIVSASKTPHYHVTSRCVRRAFLCGKDQTTGRSYEHRRGWIEKRVRLLSTVFAIDIAAYAVMSNHYHLVLTLCGAQAERWSDLEVLQRWTVLFRGPLLVQRFLADEPISEAEKESVFLTAREFRKRLKSLSWFMKCLNEPIARRANAEDECAGHFWEARFHSQPLCTEQALLAAMAYVDLNPVRAGVAESPETSEFTSIRARTCPEAASFPERTTEKLPMPPTGSNSYLCIKPLQRFMDDATGTDGEKPVPIARADYLTLIDVTSRVAVPGKRGAVDPSLMPILDRLKLSDKEWTVGVLDLRRCLRSGGLRIPKSA